MCIRSVRNWALLLTILGCSAPLWAQTGAFDPFAPKENKSVQPKKKQNASNNANSDRPGLIASVEFVDTPITTIFRMVSDLTGWSIVMSPEVSKSPPKINIWIKNLGPGEVLDEVVAMGGLVSERDGNTISVMTFHEYSDLHGVEKHVVHLEFADAKAVAGILKSYSDKKEGRVVPDEQGNNVILLVPEAARDSLLKLVKILDVPATFAQDVVKIVQIKHQEASLLVELLQDFLVENVKSRRGNTRGRATDKNLFKDENGETPTEAGEQWILQIASEPKLNLIVMRGLEADIKKAESLIAELDLPSDVYVKSYQLKFTDAEEVIEAIEEILLLETSRSRRQGNRDGNTQPERLRISALPQNNRVVVEGSPTDHDRIQNIITEIDKPLPAGTGAIRVYKLLNASSSEVTEVIEKLIEAEEDSRSRKSDRYARRGQSAGDGAGNASQSNTSGSAAASTDGVAGDVTDSVVTDAPLINAVIIQAPAMKQDEFAAVIKEMDQPREQVMLEVDLVTLEVTDDFELGVQFQSSWVNGQGVDGITQSNFDLSTVTDLFSTPPLGFSLGLFNQDDISIVLTALKSQGNTKLVSSPKILVEDNAEATLEKTSEEPYESSSQSESSTQTSLGGFVEAGTKLTVTPHIGKERIRLEYAIELSSFGVRNAAQTAANLPPPRDVNTVEGVVRIPTGHTVVLGGLIGERESHVEDKVPLLGDLPGVGHFFKSQEKSKSNEALYVFVHPVVLRDPKFTDLLDLSQQDIQHARLAKRRELQNDLEMFMPGAQVSSEKMRDVMDLKIDPDTNMEAKKESKQVKEGGQ